MVPITKSMRKSCSKMSILRFQFSMVLTVVLWSSFAHSTADNCSSRRFNSPTARDVLSLKNTAQYSNPNFKGVNLEAVLTRENREIPCAFSPPREHVKCYSSIKLYGRAAEGQELRIPEGTLINVSRINSRTEKVYLYPRKTEGLMRTRSGTFRLSCSTYAVTSQPGASPRKFGHKSSNCFNQDIDLLFQNNSLMACNESGGLDQGEALKTHRTYEDRGAGSSQNSSIE